MTLTFQEAQAESGNALTFIFTPHEHLTWVAGQSIKIEVPGPYGPLEHRFTISAAPFEKHIAITTRLSNSPYKTSLAKLRSGDTVHAFALEGEFVWRESSQPLLFIAAGIGVTPFYAMLKQRAHNGLPLSAHLIYGNASADAPFTNQFDAWQRSHPNFTVTYKTGERISAADLPDPHNHLVYISGPSAMVDELSTALIAQGLPETQLVRDWFTGRLPLLG